MRGNVIEVPKHTTCGGVMESNTDWEEDRNVPTMYFCMGCGNTFKPEHDTIRIFRYLPEEIVLLVQDAPPRKEDIT